LKRPLIEHAAAKLNETGGCVMNSRS